MGKENHLLASLPRDIYEKLAPHLQYVSLKQGQRLYEPGETIKEIYFPIDCLLSITITMNDGATVETGMVGYREMLGLNVFLGGGETTQTESTMQIPGNAIKADAQMWRKEFDCNQELRNIILRYIQAFIVQVSQTAACNRTHFIEQRLARWLLEAHDRITSDELRLTHEFIANMLGVRRAGVTQAAQNLQDSGLIRYNRGRIHILNQAGLEAFSCECFRTVKNERDRLLGIRHRG
ncbi:MAG: Crp/Fnr family transcriptional regulator [Microcoleus sp. SIO2G3]|nr:Crp/Fnr family transcriptional regulator [Microcoleus sp. SIO2G3]